MKQILVPIEAQLIESIVKIIGEAIHSKFTHNEINQLQHTLITKYREVVEATNKQHDQEKT